ncbi:hypothetical protein [Thalassococcus sp. S3]|uniref:hypothetical protein n=1 Tax=Thalassococcus sp. S3 TaxID=2017482 RepID=UPI00102411EA|nr:hypothetical protein [Thalassococcus sp. S3]QBF30271.1 hypothetical protein CFI11_03430 [Thalassococcus sp. S3]
MTWRIWAIAIGLTLAVAGLPLASSSDRFETAVSLWLDGDDAGALPEFADLAQQGHALARILLAQIELMDKGPSQFRRNLTPDQARALFRRSSTDGGPATSWLAVEDQQGNALARALRASRFPDVQPELIDELREMGEAQATDYPTRILALYGTSEDRRALLKSDALLPELRPYLLYLENNPELQGDGIYVLRHITGLGDMIDGADEDTRGIAGLLALGYGYGDTNPDNRWHATVTDWIMTDEATRPIADLCRGECGAQAGACGFALTALTGGYFEVIRLDSPLETVIPQDTFLSSPRARLMALRRAAFTRAETAGPRASIREIAEMSQCAADLVAQARSGGL